MRNLARRLEKDWKDVFASILEGVDEMLNVTRLGLPPELRRSLACTNMIENVMGTLRRVCRNVKYWRSPSMALRWAGAAMQEAAQGFRWLKAYKQLPLLKAALAEHKAKAASANPHFAQTPKAVWPLNPRRPLLDFQQRAGHRLLKSLSVLGISLQMKLAPDAPFDKLKRTLVAVASWALSSANFITITPGCNFWHTPKATNNFGVERHGTG